MGPVIPAILATTLIWATQPAFAVNPTLGSSETSATRVCLEFERDYADLVPICQRAVQETGVAAKTRAKLYRNLGEALEGTGDHPAARKAYTSAIDPDMPDPWPHIDLGWSYWLTDDYREAEAAFRQALDIRVTESALAGLASVIRNQGGDLDEATRLLDRALLIDPEYVWAIVEKGWVQEMQGDLEAAVATFDAALRIDGSYDPAHYGLAWVYDDLGRPDDALNAINAAISYDPEYAKYYGYRAFLMRMADNYRRAIDDAERALNLDPSYAHAAVQKALSQRALGYRDDMLETYGTAYAAGASSNVFHYNYADALSDAEDWQGALDQIVMAIEYASSDQYDHDLKAYILLQVDDPDGALAAALDALDIEPSHVSAALNASYASVDLDQEPDAIAYLKSARSFGADDDDINNVIRYVLDARGVLAAARFRLALVE